MLNSLWEYKNYLKFKFIIDDIKKKYAEKEQNTNAYAQTQKEIQTRETKLVKFILIAVALLITILLIKEASQLYV